MKLLSREKEIIEINSEDLAEKPKSPRYDDLFREDALIDIEKQREDRQEELDREETYNDRGLDE